ncbi:MAG: hypothetical protein JNK76_02525 [Planctomycetales bacterium]|nr:hypothetical protein [Planctomycetales bacterium]
MLVCFFAATPLFAASPVVTPSKVNFDRPESNQQLLVSITRPDGCVVDRTRIAKYRSADESIAVVDELGLVEPLRDGRTAIVVEHDGARIEVPVEVAGVDRPTPISFPRDIVLILSKTGCNTGGCHGKAEGQNGFKLSVFGYDPHGDFAALAQEGCGQRVTVDDLRYHRLRRWIQEDARYLTTDAPQVVRIEVEPREQILLARENRQLRVWAVDEAGFRRCVTMEA